MNITGVNITHPEKAARLLADEPHDIVSIIVSRLPSDVCAEVLKYCSQQDVISSMQECKSEIVDVILRRFMHRLQSLKEIDDEC
jgi:flagellar motor switch protein FliG